MTAPKPRWPTLLKSEEGPWRLRLPSPNRTSFNSNRQTAPMIQDIQVPHRAQVAVMPVATRRDRQVPAMFTFAATRGGTELSCPHTLEVRLGADDWSLLSGMFRHQLQ